MNILELDSYNLGDAVKFNEQLNPRIWQGNKMRPEVRAKLLEIAEDFKQSLGLTDLNVKDITLSGSNAGYTYTPHSDIDLHLVVDLPQADVSDVYRELFDAKKFQYNETHNIKIGGYDVELYVENANKSAVSQGIFSVINDDWIKIPLKKRSTINDNVVKNKYDVIKNHIESAIESADLERLTNTAAKIKKMRQSGLDQNGELGPENLAYKMLRSQGVIKKLYDARTAAKDHELSLRERTIQVKQPFRYGFRTTEDVSSNPSGVSPETKMFLSEKPALSQQEIVTDFVNYCVEQLGIEQLPTIKFKRDPEWSARNKTFGRYNHETNLLEVSLAGRHVMDILRTVAHELTHQRQHEVGNVPDTAGETGSDWENEANARAGVLMREYAQQHPEYFADESLEESSGYIPTKKQANDPRFKMALTKDIRPGATGKEANKMELKTDSQGRPALLMKTVNQMHEELANEFKWELALMETEILGEINMSTGSLRQEAAKTGAIAGMEFEMIVPNTENDDDGDLEPDYEQDERCRSIEDAYDFFYDGDYNSRGDVQRLRARMSNDFQEWLDDKIYRDWERGGEEYLQEWVPENVDESEWNPDGLEGEARQEALEEYIANLHNNPGSSDAFDEFREENQDSYDQSDWLDDEDLDRMSAIENQYDMSWPHWNSVGGGGEASIDDVAQEFENSIGRDTKASGNYHSGQVPRPGPDALHYIVEPDGSLEADNSSDTGLEFVSPPLPIDEILSDLNKVKAWAKEYGCYTNDSTGLHINISVPGYSRESLDFVKLALLMGDKYVLDLFGRAGNTYAKSALDMVKSKVRGDPESAQQLLEKMKGNLDSLASKAIHSGVTSKYTSINTKDGHIEFRSPGGDWLDENFEQIENTLLRFTVAMSAALNPEAYREEYLKKLYKLLTENNKDDADTIRYFSEYVAGKIPKAALRSFVKQAQLTRQVKRDTTGGKKMWWSVTNPPQSLAGIEVVATSKEEAIEKALGADGYPSWANTRQSIVAKPLRPYEEQPTQPVQQDSTPTGNWGIWVAVLDRFATMNVDGESVTRRFRDQAAARAWIQDYNIRNPGNDLELTVQEIEPAAPVPGSTLDLQRQRANATQNQYTSTPIPGVQDVELDIPFASQTLTRPGQGQQTFTGEWKVVVDGEEVYRFSGAGNNQGDANRIGGDWILQQIRQGTLNPVPGAGIEVLPVMNEDELEEGWRSALAGAAAAGAMAFTPAPTNNTAPPTGPAAQPAAVQQSPTAAAESALSKIAQAAGIKGVELAQFLAQCAHETGNFLHLEELGGNRYLAQYDPTVNPAKAKALGNTQAGDGAKYKGRGFIQITGKANYAKAGQALGIDLVNNPELAARPDVAAKVAVWYWQSRVQPRVQDFSDTRGVTKQINPGLKGLADRQSNFKDYQQQLAAVAQPKATV